MDHPLVSVIVPVYNTEAYLPRCLDSLLAQTCPDFEVILINNGSTDSCAEICRQYAERDDRFCVFAQENMGVSGARNTGLEKARGEYLMFADSDDWVEPDYISCLLEALRQENVDLVISDYCQEDFSSQEQNIPHFSITAGNYDREKFIKAFSRCPGAHYPGVLWNKIYRAEVIRRNDLRFPAGVSLGEDFVFNMSYLRYCWSVRCIPQQLYHYLWQRPGSLDQAECRFDLEARCRNRNVLFRAYAELFRSWNMASVHRYRMIFYALKAYSDDAEVLAADASARKLLYDYYIRQNGISRFDFLAFRMLKMGKGILSGKRG